MPKGNSQGNPSDSFPFRFALTKESEDLIFERSRITCVAQSDRYNSGKAERGVGGIRLKESSEGLAQPTRAGNESGHFYLLSASVQMAAVL